MSGQPTPFSIRRFLLLVGLQSALFGIAFRYLAPAMWARQLRAGPGEFLLTFVIVLLVNCFFEWVFHRYVLHATIHRFLIRFSRGHGHHHSLTAIRLRSNEAGTGRIIINRYPITEVEQYEDATFPPYALIVFWMVFTPPLLLAQFFFGHAPVLLAGYAAVTWSMINYEVWHAIEHFPYEWWKHAVEHPRFGWLWKRVYGFHHFHHANIGVNEAIGGFFGLPIADWVFRTYHQPKDLLLEGRIATVKEFKVELPWPFVAWLDSWAHRREVAIRRKYPELFKARSH